MYPIDTATATDDHKFTDGNSSATPPVLPTQCNAAFFNCIQEELLNILAGVGLSPNAANNAQVWDALKKIGINSVYAEASDDPEEPNAGDISSSGFDGPKFIFHDESDFSIEAMKTGSLLVIIPLWNAASSVDHITVSYNNNNIRIEKWNIYIGLVANGAIDDLAVLGARIPFLRNGGKGLTVGELFAGSLKCNEVIDNNVVAFTYDAEDVDSWQEWQLSSNWKNGQVKKVYATNDNEVSIFCNGIGTVKFKKGCYKEFVCIDFVTVGETEYAKFIMNG